jgi:protease-4
MKRLLVYVLSLALLLAGCAYVNVSVIPRKKPLKEQVLEGRGRAKILLVDISGLILNRERPSGIRKTKPALTVYVKESLDNAAGDRNIKGVVLRINSPGGTVTASDMIYHEVREFRERTGVPVYASIMDLGTSGAYYISQAADRVSAHPTSVTGSIGVIALKFNVRGLLGKIGVEEKSVKSGEMKDIFSPFRPDTDEEREIIQTIIDSLHERFVEAVSEGRKGRMAAERIKALSDGRPYTARQALDAGLIDSIEYLGDTIEAMKKEAGVAEAKVITYAPVGSYKGTIYSSLGEGSGGGLPGSAASFINIDAYSFLENVSFMYVWGLWGLGL